jgi:hypothetical protein
MSEGMSVGLFVTINFVTVSLSPENKYCAMGDVSKV